MNRKGIKKLLVALAILLMAQIFWWGFLIIDKQSDITNLVNTKDSYSELSATKVMIFSEGLVFVLIWTFGVVLAYRFYKKESELRLAHKDFLSAITHELKTPIANIQLSLESLDRPDLSDIQRKTFTDRAIQALNTLNSQIDSVLISTSEEFAEQKVSKINLRALFFDLLKDFPLTSKYIDINIGNNVTVHSSPSELPVVLRHVLDNAIKYTVEAKKGESLINVTAEELGDRVRLIVSDNGIGFSEEEMANVSRPYWRSYRSQAYNIKGTGLGLLLTRTMCERMNVGFIIESPGADQGASIVLDFPKGTENA